MNDFDDDLINDAFGGFTAAAESSVRPMGAQAARSTVKRRRKARASALGLLAALLIVAPVAAYATIDRESQGPPLNPAESVTAVPSVTPQESPSASVPTAPTAPTGPDGRISIAQLRAGKITLPAWDPAYKQAGADGQCRDGLINLDSDGDAVWHVAAKQVVHLNLDADTAQETAALISCRIGEVSRGMVVVFDRDEQGRIVTVSQVVASSERMAGIWKISVDSAGQLLVEVSNVTLCCDDRSVEEIHQDRAYAWNGTKVVQVGGPTSFSTNG